MRDLFSTKSGTAENIADFANFVTHSPLIDSIIVRHKTNERSITDLNAEDIKMVTKLEKA